MEQVPKEKALNICKFGQLEATCMYLIGGAELFQCAKDTSLELDIEARVETGTNVAKGYNCSKGRGGCVTVCANKDISCDTCKNHSNIVCEFDLNTEGVKLCKDRCSKPCGRNCSVVGKSMLEYMERVFPVSN